MSGNTVQVLYSKTGAPRKRPEQRRRNPINCYGNDFELECLKGILEYRLEIDGRLWSRNDTAMWTFVEMAKILKVGPFAENGNE
jgi:hypothetical protein